jgi:hypothetical protein
VNDGQRVRPFRVSLLGLMGVVLACGVGSYWLTHPTFQAASQAFTAAITVLLFAILAAIYGRHRTFWIGFLIFGAVYFALAFGPWTREAVRPYMYTSHLLGDLANLLGLTTKPLTGPFDPSRVGLDSGLNRFFWYNDGERFQRIGHSLAALAHGMVGGCLAVFLGSRRHSLPEVDRSPS